VKEPFAVGVEKAGDRTVFVGGLYQDQPGLADPKPDEIDPTTGQALARQGFNPENPSIAFLRLIQVADDDVDVVDSAGDGGCHLG